MPADLPGYGVADGLADGLAVAGAGRPMPLAGAEPGRLCALGLADGVGRLGMGGGEKVA